MTKEDLRIVFLGTPDFAVESLSRIVAEGYNVVGVVTMPDKPAGRGHKMLQSPVKQFALEHGLHLMQPPKLKDPAFVEELRNLNADLFIVIAFRMLPEMVWTMPPLGTFNLHGSLLPRYRGAAPINRAIMNGDTSTGVTTFFLKHEIDTGDVIDRRAIEIGPDENVGSVHDRLMMLGAELTLDTLAHILAGDLKPMPQQLMAEAAEACDAPKIFKDDCRLDWSRSARELHNHVRGLSPYPGAWTTMETDSNPATDIKIFATRVAHEDRTGTTAGKVSIEDRRMYVDCGKGRLEILELQPTGKRRMATSDWLLGARISQVRFI